MLASYTSTNLTPMSGAAAVLNNNANANETSAVATTTAAKPNNNNNNNNNRLNQNQLRRRVAAAAATAEKYNDDAPKGGTGILDVIMESSKNTERFAQIEQTKIAIAETIQEQARAEKSARESTITVKHSDQLQPRDVIALSEKFLNTDNSSGHQLPAASYWQDKENSYVQFICAETKEEFIRYAKSRVEAYELCKSLLEYDDLLHFRRKPVRFEVLNVKTAISSDQVNEALTSIALLAGVQIVDLKEGKTNTISRCRSFFFRGDASVFGIFIESLGGQAPISNGTGKTAKLYVKVNARPWSCKACFKYGQHECEGRACANCGASNHTTKECKQKTKYCRNCRMRGHRARDMHCPAFLNMVSKELRKMDIPIGYMENNSHMLIKHIKLK